MPSGSERSLVWPAVVATIACCGVTALAATVIGGLTIVAVGRVTVVSLVALLAIVAAMGVVERRRRGRCEPSTDEADEVEVG